MLSRADIENLAQLSRLSLTEQEVVSYEKDFASILDYVSQVSAVTEAPGGVAARTLHTVMREDVVVSDAPGNTRESLLAAFPKQQDDYDVVRKIIEK